MTGQELSDLIASGVIKPDSELFVVQGDQAYPVTVKILQSGRGRKNRNLYILPDQAAESKDYPEGFAGVREVMPLGQGKPKETHD